MSSRNFMRMRYCLAAVVIGGQAVQAQTFRDGKVCWPDAAYCSVAEREPEARAAAQRPLAKPINTPTKIRPAEAPEQSSAPVPKLEKVAIQVSQNDKGSMELALNNARNIVEYHKAKGARVVVQVVAYGPGLHMLRADTSPVRDRIAAFALETPVVTFKACANTQANQSKAEGKPVELLSEATVVPSGAVHLVELQEQGYAYVRP